MGAEGALKVILRLIGSSSLLALIFLPMPHAWMDSIHASLGLGPLPDQPVVGYLARSLCFFYALVGGLFWLVSFDLARHRRVLLYFGWVTTLLGPTLFVVDTVAGLPRWWTLWEGPFILVLGLAMLYLTRRIAPGGSVGP